MLQNCDHSYFILNAPFAKDPSRHWPTIKGTKLKKIKHKKKKMYEMLLLTSTQATFDFKLLAWGQKCMLPKTKD